MGAHTLSGVVSHVNPNMIQKIFMEGMVGCPVSNLMICMEKILKVPVESLEQPIHPKTLTPDHIHYHHIPHQRSCYA
jgi:hypothetical protein